MSATLSYSSFIAEQENTCKGITLSGNALKSGSDSKEKNLSRCTADELK
jgi:hypothetical protein